MMRRLHSAPNPSPRVLRYISDSVSEASERKVYRRKAVFDFEKAVQNSAGSILNLYLKEDHGGWNSDDNENNNLGRIRLSVTDASGAVADPLPDAVRAILKTPRAQRTAAQEQAIFRYWRT